MMDLAATPVSAAKPTESDHDVLRRWARFAALIQEAIAWGDAETFRAIEEGVFQESAWCAVENGLTLIEAARWPENLEGMIRECGERGLRIVGFELTRVYVDASGRTVEGWRAQDGSGGWIDVFSDGDVESSKDGPSSWALSKALRKALGLDPAPLHGCDGAGNVRGCVPRPRSIGAVDICGRAFEVFSICTLNGSPSFVWNNEAIYVAADVAGDDQAALRIAEASARRVVANENQGGR